MLVFIQKYDDQMISPFCIYIDGQVPENIYLALRGLKICELSENFT